MYIRLLIPFAFVVIVTPTFSQVNVSIDVTEATHSISPYLYGRNNSVSDNPDNPLSDEEWQKLRDAGVRFLRESGGNNSTKYNWRRKLSSHPDWYNNVYAHDWDFAAKSIQDNLPNAQGMWSFQLIGKAAKTSSANFNDWDYNGSQWWEGVRQNLAGGGVVNPDGENALTEGNPDHYLETWTADSTVGILDHWFGENGIGLDPSRILYWNMDNEPEVWNGTHDDVVPSPIQPEEYMQMYFDVAKKARQKFPEIQLVGPVATNEWQWYNWPSGAINYKGKHHTWLEYFIRRVAEEQEATGVRLLDVLDIHYYPSRTDVQSVVQYHRVFFDKTYDYPEANGVKTLNGGWDASQTKEYILQRCRDWLENYMGDDHGVTFSVTETGIPDIGPDGIVVWYASTLGEFMKQPDMKIFSPWHWYPSMWEVMHLFSRFNKTEYVPATSSNETIVSAYPSINLAADSLTVVVVNRSAQTSQDVTLSFNGFVLANQPFEVQLLDALPPGETFLSRSQNALRKSAVVKSGNKVMLSLPALSVATVILKGEKGEVISSTEAAKDEDTWSVFPNPTNDHRVIVEVRRRGNAVIQLIDANGGLVRTLHRGQIFSKPFSMSLDVSNLPTGSYIIRLRLDGSTFTKKLVR